MSPKATLGPLRAVLIGAACGVVLFALLGRLMFLDVRHLDEGYFRNYFLLPAMGAALLEPSSDAPYG